MGRASVFDAGREPHAPRVLRRFVFAEHGPGFWTRLWIAAAVLELAALVPVVFDTGQKLRAQDTVFIFAAGSFIACGLVAWRRRPDNHSGRLMTATGFVALAYPLLSQLDWALAATAALLLYSAWTIGYVALLLTFQTGGRIQSPVDGVIVGVFALTLLVLQFVWMLFLEADGNVLAIVDDAGVANAIDRGRRWLTAAASLAVLLVIAARWRAASGPRRRSLLPGLVGGLSALLFTVLLVDGLVADRPSDVLWWLANAALLLVPAAYLGGLLRSRLARGGLAPLLLGLRTMRGEQLQAALARTVGDPNLELVHAGAPRPSDGRSVALIEREGREVAGLVYDASLDDDPELIEAVSAAAAMALENERLHEESYARMAELRASRQRLVSASDEERRRLERNLHDGAQQRLVAVAIQLQLIQKRVRDDPGMAEELASAAAAELMLSLEELRELARGLHPPVLERGLTAAVHAAASRSPVPTSVSGEVPRDLPQPVELAAYFVVSEALANVAKYAEAGAVEVRLGIEGANLAITIADDGVGGASPDGGSGLRGLTDRVEALGGHLDVQSARGAGTVVRAELPLDGDRSG